MELTTVLKGEVLQEAGVIPTHVFQVSEGLLRAYFLDELGKEHTFLFAPEGWLISDLDALGFQKPGVLIIEALEDSKVQRASILEGNSNVSSEEASAHFKQLYRRAGSLQRRVLMMMSNSALERYEYFLETYPDLSARISQKLIASYLGITPQALSKLRRERVTGGRS
mgnify:FL=1